MTAGRGDRAERLSAVIDELVDEYRLRCLWFMKPGFYPRTEAECVRVLDSIARYGDLAAFRRAGALRQWLSRPSSEPSAAS